MSGEETGESELVDAEEGAVVSDAVGTVGWVTDPGFGLTSAQVEKSRELHGTNDIPKHVTPTYMLFLRQFVGFMPILIEIAAILSLALEDWPDFGIIVAMLFINGLLGFREEYHAKKALEELSSSLESEVAVVRDGVAEALPVSQLVTGDIVLLVGGNMVPADVKWLRGDTMSIDTAALTGEPIPRKYPGDHGDVMLSGTTVKAGECYAQCVAVGTSTEMGRAQADVLADKQVTVVSVFQRKIMMIVQYTISFSLVMVIAVLLVEGVARKQPWHDAVLAALVILIAAIPIALPLVMQVVMALGAAFLAKEHHAIVTSIPALQDIASMSILCSDKTGTLTTAKMSIMTDSIFAVDGVNPLEVLLYAYLSANADKKDDPIDRAVVAAFHENAEAQELLKSKEYKQTGLIGFNPEVKRVVAFVDHKKGKVTIAKGLVAKIMDTHAGGEDSGELQWVVEEQSNKKFIEMVMEKDKAMSKAGYKTIAIAVCEEDARETEVAKWRFKGLLPMLDPPRHDTAQTIASLHHANISVKMITGDHVNVGRETARLIGLGTNILPGEQIRTTRDKNVKDEMIWEADGFAAVLPSDKREVVLTLRNDFGVVCGMTGDGVNDAPALSAAQVGIAVQGATDAAKHAADLILTEPGLSPIYGAVIEARRIFAKIKAYVIYRIAASITLVLTLSVIVFVSGCTIDSIMVIVLALLNDVSMIPVAYDKADATVKPQLPRATALVALSAFYGVCQTSVALIFFYAIGDTKLHDFNLNECTNPTKGAVWLYLVIATELMIFSTRASSFFWGSMPSLLLLASVLGTCVLGIILARFAPIFIVPGDNIGWIVMANAIVFVLLDFGKVGFRLLIGDGAGEIIKGDGLVELKVEEESEATKALKKKMRYEVHRGSVLAEEDRSPSIEIIDTSSIIGKFRAASVTDGFIRRNNAPSFDAAKRSRIASRPLGGSGW